MKTRIPFLAAALASVAFSTTAAFAHTADCAAKTEPKATLPVPVEVVHFSNLPRQYENVTIKLALTIDEKGQPHNVRAAEPIPADLAKRILPLVTQWRFTPSYVDGKPVTARVILPLELIEGV